MNCDSAARHYQYIRKGNVFMVMDGDFIDEIIRVICCNLEGFIILTSLGASWANYLHYCVKFLCIPKGQLDLTS